MRNLMLIFGLALAGLLTTAHPPLRAEVYGAGAPPPPPHPEAAAAQSTSGFGGRQPDDFDVLFAGAKTTPPLGHRFTTRQPAGGSSCRLQWTTSSLRLHQSGLSQTGHGVALVTLCH